MNRNMRVCQGRINIVAQTKLESVDDILNRNMRVCQGRINIEAQTKLESVVDIINRNMRVCQERSNLSGSFGRLRKHAQSCVPVCKCTFLIAKGDIIHCYATQRILANNSNRSSHNRNK